MGWPPITFRLPLLPGPSRQKFELGRCQFHGWGFVVGTLRVPWRTTAHGVCLLPCTRAARPALPCLAQSIVLRCSALSRPPHHSPPETVAHLRPAQKQGGGSLAQPGESSDQPE